MMNSIEEWLDMPETKEIFRRIEKVRQRELQRLADLVGTTNEVGTIRHAGGVIYGLGMLTNKEFIESLKDEA